MQSSAGTEPDKRAYLDVVGVGKAFKGTTVMSDMDFRVARGELVSLLGPSGCGKTTIMRMIAGFLEPTSGDIRIKGGSVLNTPPNKRPVNMVFQHLALFPMMTIAENIGYGLRRNKVPKDQIAHKVDEALERIGLPGIGHRKVDELSGGQKQRVAIARCMVLEPDVLLLDEPTAGMARADTNNTIDLLKEIKEKRDITIAIIEHDMHVVFSLADRITVLAQGTPLVEDSPENIKGHPKVKEAYLGEAA